MIADQLTRVTPTGIARGDATDLDLAVTLLLDMHEERWPSMDLVGSSIYDALQAQRGLRVQAVCPRMPRRFSGADDYTGRAYTIDRFLARHWDYARHLGRNVRLESRHVFHVIDHSYAQLVHALPAHRTVVTCHDLDAFRSVLGPTREARSWLFRQMMQRVLAGLQRAAHVVCVSEAVKAELLATGAVPAQRVSVVWNGVASEFDATPNADADAEAKILLSPIIDAGPYLLHVGSTIARKRIDDLLHVLASVRAVRPGTPLVRVGGPLTEAQQALARQLKVEDGIVTLPFLSRSVLAAVYRRAAFVLLPSSAEGFGLPVIEALACGARVVASDLPVLREVGGTACSYRPVGAHAAWSEAILAGLADAPATRSAHRTQAVAHASQYRWRETAIQLTATYRSVLDAA